MHLRSKFEEMNSRLHLGKWNCLRFANPAEAVNGRGRTRTDGFAEVFLNIFGARAPNMHFKNFPGRRDLSPVKFSAPCDACSSKKLRKTETRKIRKSVQQSKIWSVFNFLEELRILEPHWQVRLQKLVPITPKSASYDPWQRGLRCFFEVCYGLMT